MDKSLSYLAAHMHNVASSIVANQPGITNHQLRLWLHAEFDYLYELAILEDFSDTGSDENIHFTFKIVGDDAFHSMTISYERAVPEIKYDEMPASLASTLGY